MPQSMRHITYSTITIAITIVSLRYFADTTFAQTIASTTQDSQTETISDAVFNGL